MRNDFGKEIYENICADCWREAIGYGTKVMQNVGPAHPGILEPRLGSAPRKHKT
jgi:hypothetical protein